MPYRSTPSAIAWNLFLLSVGAILFAVGVNGAVVGNTFITGGAYGAALLIWYKTHLLSPSIWFFLFNIPLFLLGWFYLDRRFFWYSLYGMITVTLACQWI